MPRRVVPLKRSGHTLQSAAAAFLDRPVLSPASRRSYAQTFRRLMHAIGGDQPLAVVSDAEVEAAVDQAWGHCAPATWNRHGRAVK